MPVAMAADATQYLLPEGLGLEAALSRLATCFDLAAGPVGRFERTFYDTFDGRLHAAGLVLMRDGTRLVAATGATYRELAAGSTTPGERLRAAELPSGPLRALIEPIVEVRTLAPIARTRGRTRALGVCNGDRKTVVRLVLEAAKSAAGPAEVPLRSRLNVIGVRGYDRALARVRRALVEDLGFEVTDVPVHDEVVTAAGGSPGGTRSKLDLRLRSGEPAVGGTALALTELLRTIEQNLPGTLDDVDSEFLHDLRVAVRRTRALQRQLSAVFPPDRLRWFSGEFRWLGQITGPTRDLDVLLFDFARMRAGLPIGRAAELEPLGALLDRRRELERRRMAVALGSARTSMLLAGWAAFLAELRALEPAVDSGVRSLGGLVGKRIRAVYRELRRAGLAIDDGTPPEALHDLRKQAKELRYLLEIFADLYPAEAVRPTVRRLKALQETLGEFQDREVQGAMLRSFGAELASAAGGPAALITLGVVLERIDADTLSARAAFGKRFAGYAADAQRAIIRDAFR